LVTEEEEAMELGEMSCVVVISFDGGGNESEVEWGFCGCKN
jgi:hypothetical protein